MSHLLSGLCPLSQGVFLPLVGVTIYEPLVIRTLSLSKGVFLPLGRSNYISMSTIIIRTLSLSKGVFLPLAPVTMSH